ncbi:pyridoxamine 5'-phosphate oxidase family protein [Streptomyces sp. NPDC046887]|uniref:pyridoxamine 5'-phosphate oxidase family protein n=1 Tax=Streptomyces sp. NPDC046887 TaxID=3155472 RepID=UPI003410052F
MTDPAQAPGLLPDDHAFGAVAPAPEGELDPRYSDPAARAAPWEETRRLLAEAELYWIASIRPGAAESAPGSPGPHVTPVAGAWHEGALWFVSLPSERKVLNLVDNPRCALLTGTNRIFDGTDVVLEGRAVRVVEKDRLDAAAEVFRHKYGPPWDYVVEDGTLSGSVGRAWAFSVAPERVFAFSKNPMAQTRWRFAP